MKIYSPLLALLLPLSLFAGTPSVTRLSWRDPANHLNTGKPSIVILGLHLGQVNSCKLVASDGTEHTLELVGTESDQVEARLPEPRSLPLPPARYRVKVANTEGSSISTMTIEVEGVNVNEFTRSRLHTEVRITVQGSRMDQVARGMLKGKDVGEDYPAKARQPGPNGSVILVFDPVPAGAYTLNLHNPAGRWVWGSSQGAFTAFANPMR